MGHRLAMVALVVPDYDEGIAFWCDVVGFTLVEDAPLAPPKRWVVVSPGAGGANLLLARAATAEQRAAVGNQTGGRVGFFLDTDDLAADHARLRAAGVAITRGPVQEPYGRVAVFRDPWGNQWDLVERN